jgi:beta-glucosidase
MPRSSRPFPDGFLWGTATASYQIEGAVAEGGRGPSIWDTFSHTPGKIAGGDTGDVADDHYHRWQSDLDLMVELGVPAYRLSIAWPRILPTGTSEVNPAGIDFYARLLDGLHERGITPFVTLYHWDLPQALEDRGGWQSRDTVDAYLRYTDVVRERLGDRIGHWITFNEPWVSSLQGYGSGRHAPGLRDGHAALLAAHHLLLGHGRALDVLDGAGDVGITLNLTDAQPGSERPDDLAATRRFDGNINRWFLDPLLRGEYPRDMVEWYGDDAAGVVQPGDLDAISRPMDFLGINFYYRTFVVAGGDPGNPRFGLPDIDAHSIIPDGLDVTAMGWPVTPDGFRSLLVRLHRDYPNLPPVYITENGAAFDDEAGPDGAVHDDRRVSYLREHITAVRDAIDDGVDVRGYFVWSLLDNFEWAEGYAKRFGIVRVDYGTQERIVKDSGRFYSQVVAAKGVPD